MKEFHDIPCRCIFLGILVIFKYKEMGVFCSKDGMVYMWYSLYSYNHTGHCHLETKLRVYPRRFGKKVCSLMPQLCTKGEGQPTILEVSPESGPQTLRDLAWSDWPEANLVEVLRYTRGNKHLNMPSIWKDVLPKRV